MNTMRRIALGAAMMALASFAGTALAGYADDRAEIENISNKYMVAVDAGDIDTVMSTWADDGVLEWVNGIERGKEAIRKAMSNFGGARAQNIPEGATSRPRTRHQIINHVIDVEGDTAHTTAYWFAFTNNTPQKDVQVLVRVRGKWLFKQRKVFNESQNNRAVIYPGLGEKDPRKK
jgi:ketosteroid isomerase-like protein